MNNPLRNMMILSRAKTKRASSWDRTGGNRDFIRIGPGETAILAEIEGPGVINHFYVTLMSRDLFVYRRAILRMFWDGEETPSVEAPLGDFFGVPFAAPQFFQSLVVSVNPGWRGIVTDGLNVYFPMPFAKGARIEVFNDSDIVLNNLWHHINYDELPELESELGYFHACWRREKETGAERYVLLDARGRGNYAGCILQVENLAGGWCGEGDEVISIDAEQALGGPGKASCEAYSTPCCGALMVDDADRYFGRNAMYTFFVADPIRFRESIRATVEHGHANGQANDYCSVAYWYQEEPHGTQPALPHGAELEPRIPEELLESVALYNEAGAWFRDLERNVALLHGARHDLRWAYHETKAALLSHDIEQGKEKARQYHQDCKAAVATGTT